ncbi:hypothetical protein [Methylobacterium soli]|uniref:Uncharacterized protein n=1 Tax=Methylobacterium soli TaxID=553447 RepID=A0A6L3T1J2_9HYPH|nr:hypothetical protein [Methylobacterium soli]KAB1078547.1 hypothetical protein F6X53_14200 [Methylobacterium soli]GJE44377.1 hypothetical protein AEGHOMDF_3565 [Methylobacterium soli]
MKGSGLVWGLAVLLPVAALAQAPLPQAAAPMVGGAHSGQPANLCKELSAFLHPPASEAGSGTPPPQAATAVQAPSQDKPVPKPGESGAPQKESGQSGPIPNAGPGAAGPQGEAQKGGQAAPKAEKPSAPAAASAPKPAPEAIARADDAARANDLQACRAIAQELRRAGVAMPAPLIALSAMDPRLLEASLER